MGKIVYYASSIIPSKAANSVHVMKMCQALADCGNEVELVVSDQQEFECENVYDFYGVRENFKIKRIHKKSFKGKEVLFSIDTVRYIKHAKPDLAYGRNSLTYTLLLMHHFQKCGFEFHQPLSSFFEKILKIAIKDDSKVVTISGTLKDHVKDRYGLENDHVLVAHDGADAIEGSIELKTSLKSVGKFNVGYVGQLYPGKGMEIIAELVRLMPEVMFHIIGGNDKDIDKWKIELSSNQNVVFYGFVPHKETQCYINAMDILLAPYGTKVYGVGYKKGNKQENLANYMSPLKLFEYMAVGKPVITTDLPVLREIIDDGENGLLCAHDDISAWEKAIVQLMNSSELRETLSKNARYKFNNEFTWKKRAENIVKYYEV